MNELGHILREAREARGLTLAEVEGETRINSRFLAALEEGEYQLLPTPVHVRGFLRNYARYLGLDPQPLLDRYAINQERFEAVSTNQRLEEPEALDHKPLNLPHNQPFFDPVNVEVTTTQATRGGNESSVRLVIIAALLVMLYLVGSQFVPRVLGNREQNAALTETLTNSVNDLVTDFVGGEVEPTAVPDTILETDPDSFEPSSVLTSTSRNDSPTVIPTRPNLPATMETINITVDVTERSFLEVTVDGDTVFSGTALNGDTFEWQADEEVVLLTGNAIGVNVTINEVNLGRLGGRGQNLEEVWRTTN